MGFDILVLIWGASLLVKLVLLLLAVFSAISWAIIVFKWRELSGATWPGVPVFWVGNNAKIAWGQVALHASVSDLFDETFHPTRALSYDRNGRWRDAKSRVETLKVRGQADQEIEPYLNMLGKVVRSTSGVRRPGAAALDLAYVAAGRLDAFWETGLAPWDLAAGSLLIREAGGIISGLDGSENFLDTGHVLCGTPKIYKDLAKLCATEIHALT